jgi:uncharacterized membrane protein
MPIESSSSFAIAVIAIVTAMTRVAGPILMRYVNITPRIERFLEAMSISVIAAILVSAISEGGLRGAGAALVAATIMITFRNTALAMISGTVFAAGWTFLMQ